MKKITLKNRLSNLSSKRFSRYQTNILLRGLKFTPTTKHNNIELKSNIQSYTHKLRFAEFFQNKETYYSEEDLFQKQSFISPQDRDRELGH